jgi:AraC-like DNA-binding protein
MPLAQLQWEDAFSAVEPRIDAEGVHTWSFDPACPAAARFFLLDRGRHIRMNRHDYFEIFYLHQGEAICHIQDLAIPMLGGGLALVKSGQYHSMRLPAQAVVSRAKCASLYFRPEMIRAAENAREGAEYLTPFLIQKDSFPQVIAEQPELTREVFSLIKRIHAEMHEKSARAPLAVKTYLKMILLLLVKHYADRDDTAEIFDRRQRDIGQLSPLFDYLETHYQQPISIESAAAILGLSKSQFMRLFKHVTGQPFVVYLNHFRIAKAQALLETTDLSISEVGLEVGFCNQSYFGSIFRNLSHMTPLQYRRQRYRDGGTEGQRMEDGRSKMEARR